MTRARVKSGDEKSDRLVLKCLVSGWPLDSVEVTFVLLASKAPEAAQSRAPTRGGSA